MKQYINLLFCFALVSLLAIELSAQCNPYRYNTSPHSGWMSCEVSESPNIDRGESHWLHYDLGINHTLHSSWIWNHNSITSLTNGVISYVVDYRVEGEDFWTELGIYSLDLSEGSAYYTGVEGPDFGGLTARYVLITLLQNGGGDCYGFGEWKIETGEALSDIDEIAAAKWFTVYPNPTNDNITIDISQENSAHSIELLDLLGKSVIGLTPLVGHSQTLDIRSLESGIYTVCLVGGSARNCQKISVIKD